VIEIGRRQFFEKGGGLLEGGRGREVFRGERLHGDIEGASEFTQTSDGDVAAAELDLPEEAR
jgi:hypothetical protein